MDKIQNEVKIIMAAKSINEGFSRIAAAAFLTPVNPSVADMTDIKTAVSEAVTNAIIHGYDGSDGEVSLIMKLAGDDVYIEVSDSGQGIEDIEKAMEPLYTSKPEMERSGMGFTVMETFMDSVSVTSVPGKGTTVVMRKKLPEKN